MDGWLRFCHLIKDWYNQKGGHNMLFDAMFFFDNGHWNDEDDDDW